MAPFCLAQNNPSVTLDSSENIFTVLAAINACGYDAGLSSSLALRSTIRSEVKQAIQSTPDGNQTLQDVCQFYNEHQESTPAHTLSRYISLALFLGPSPTFTPDSDIALDAQGLVDFVPLLAKFYTQANLQKIWDSHRDDYNALQANYHETVSKVLFDTEIYLKLPSSGYLGRQFTIYLQPLGDPDQTNARNYRSDYYVVITPGLDPAAKMPQIRHAYLHYLLDPLILKYPEEAKRLQPLLDAAKNAPMDESFKTDTTLFVTECLIRAVEIRTSGSRKTPEAERQQAVDDAVKQGFLLTRYFYGSLVRFEKDPAGFRNAYGDMLAGVDVRKEVREASQIKFSAKSQPELVSRPTQDLLASANRKLMSGDTAAAQKLAQTALDTKQGDPGQAAFILAQVAIMSRDIEGAQKYFAQALQTTKDTKIVAWSHIYLGRILDLQEDRAGALDHYRAALVAANMLPEAKAAAEHGIQQPYAPPATSNK